MNKMILNRKSGCAPINGLDLYYELSGEGPPAVYFHPFLSYGDAHGGDLCRYISHRRWLTMDQQGHGHTPDIDRPLSFEQAADDAAALMRRLDIQNADLFGESFGGIVAMLLAIRHPKLARRVATYGSSMGRFQETKRPESRAQLTTLTADHRSVQCQRESYRRIAPDPDAWPGLFEKATHVAWGGIDPDELKFVQIPVLVMGGDHDVLGPRPEHLLEVSRSLPKGQLAIIPDAGHFVVYDAPETILPLVSRFFDSPDEGIPFATTLTGYHPGETR
ncbi:MAG TPA: alpha/beta hydrolase [Sphingomicrobium sp.]|jgi:pimeloyl-ACP methyl ester carboxylesterase|nr:alpha/beta hydrolase [Sphingomicrobium sp.]